MTEALDRSTLWLQEKACLAIEHAFSYNHKVDLSKASVGEGVC